jgi:hypothetical protein
MNRTSSPPPADAPRLMAAAQPAPALKLTRDEMSILDAFRAMDERRKWEALTRMERIAGTHPLRVGPRLRLISGSAN